MSESALPVMIPILSIQPLVENAVKHGVAAKVGPGRVVLRVQNQGGALRVSVEDTGAGFRGNNGSAIQKEGAGVGLANVRRRLHLSYGPEAALVVSSSELGSTVTFSIPVTAPSPSARRQEVEALR